MPYEWLPPAPGEETIARLHLWPFRSLPRRGFVWFIAATAVLLAVPLLSVLGSPVLWGLLPFLLLAVWGIWAALSRSYRDGEILEELDLRKGHVTLRRTGPRGAVHSWEANPHWVRVTLHVKDGPVPNYLTLRGAGREVEIGAFLSEAERLALMPELVRALERAH